MEFEHILHEDPRNETRPRNPETVHKPAFTNAQETHLQNPDTFYVPPKELLDDIEAGDQVRLGILGQRFWVTVVRVFDNGAIHGKVCNRLFGQTPFNFGDVVEFYRKNIHEFYDHDSALMQFFISKHRTGRDPESIFNALKPVDGQRLRTMIDIATTSQTQEEYDRRMEQL